MSHRRRLARVALLAVGLAAARAADRPAVRLTAESEGVRVTVPGGDASIACSLALRRQGPPHDLRPASVPTVRAGTGSIEIVREGLTERFILGPAEVVHRIELDVDGSDGAAWLDYGVGGDLTPKLDEDGRRVELQDGRGAPRMIYRDLEAIDAEGREVAVRWGRVDGGLRWEILGSDHAYPIRASARLTAGKRSTLGTAPPGPEGVLAVPPNDGCAGAEVIPDAGPFPFLSSIVDVTEATASGDPPLPSCQPDVSHSVWYAFTPAASGDYTFSLCADGPTGTTVDDTVLAIYAGGCGAPTELPGGCDDDSCSVSARQSSIRRVALTAGTSYRIVAFKFDPDPPAAGASAVQLRVVQEPPAGPAPPNDSCAGAEVIPGSGPFPYTTLLTPDITAATTSGDPPPPSCQGNLSRSLWYLFTPAETGRYTFSVCADGPTGTTVDDTVMAIYTGSCEGLTELSGGCDDDGCVGEAAQSVLDGVPLTSGTSYRIGVWQFGTAPPATGNTAVQMIVRRVVEPPHDTCADALALSLEIPAAGSTIEAANDTQLPSGSTCFGGIGQTASTASGGDLVYRFRAPAAGRYSFRATGFDASRNAVLYVASDCPVGPAPATIAGCLGAANRNPAYPDEEVACLLLGADQEVFVYVDENAPSAGGAFLVEASRCVAETEPNGSPSVAQEPACGIEGTIAPAGDVDVYTLGIPAGGSRVFAMADGAAGNSTDFDLRVTTAADTLEYDDLNNDAPFGTVAPNVSGAPLGGSESFLRVSHYSAGAQAEPYRVYAAVEPPAASASAEVEPNGTSATASVSPLEYWSGSVSPPADVDVFSFSAAAGELVVLQLDTDPSRDGTPFNGSLALLDASGATVAFVDDGASTSSTASGAGSLVAKSPTSPGEAIAYRIRSSGGYFAKVGGVGGSAGDYLLSIAHDCRIGAPTDLAVTQTDSPDPVPPGGSVTYSIAVRNLGNAPATVVTIRDALPAGSSFVSASTTQGACVGTGPVVCHLGDLAAGATATIQVVVTAPTDSGPISNVARGSMAAREAASGNETASETTQVAAADGDGDGVADPADCAPSDPSAWAIPGEATGLLFVSGKTTLQWSAPEAPGGTVVRYDLLRSGAASTFATPACVASNVTSTSANDPSSPTAAFHYLVRSENACGGSLGARSDGTPRSGGACP